MDALAPGAPVLPTPVGMLYCVCILFLVYSDVYYSCSLVVLQYCPAMVVLCVYVTIKSICGSLCASVEIDNCISLTVRC